MRHAEHELQSLKDEVSQMWKLVLSQLEKSKQAFMEGDIELAREIASREKRVDAFELKIDSDCENYIVLYSPVAIDLRLVLSLIKISITLERIGDFAESIARHVIEDDGNKPEAQVVEELQIEKMFDTLIGMLSDSFVALEAENTRLSGKIMAKDDEIDTIYSNSFDILTPYLQKNPEHIRNGLKIALLMRKLERIGDHCNNIVEEIVFYVDAKVLKHSVHRLNQNFQDEQNFQNSVHPVNSENSD
ncbi:MAG: phosphate signaling complex protein PhoU [Prevotellaceae bacterium]|jgi:phosphate transport system protein|nr:phosphate signaling complex protein PhoU [Prevotellaceae bacterium]